MLGGEGKNGGIDRPSVVIFLDSTRVGIVLGEKEDFREILIVCGGGMWRFSEVTSS